jgi:hypothetical protein
MEDEDDDAEMAAADYGTDFSDDVDPNFDAKALARPQQGSTVEIRSRQFFAGASRRGGPVQA